MSRARSSILFIHGLWLHPSSWAPWMHLFSERGYEPSAPGWPGVASSVEDTRANPDDVADRGIEEVADYYTRIIDRMPRRPVVIGHSFGGLIAEMLVAHGRAAAAITIGAAHVDGVPWLPFAPLRDSLPVFKDPANRDRAISLTAEQFRDSFGNAVDEQESDELYERWSIPAPSRPLFEAAEQGLALYLPYSQAHEGTGRSPSLVVLAGKDHIVPPDFTGWAAAEGSPSAATDVVEFADRGHSLTIDRGWQEIAETCVDWLWNEHDL
jgi:pimeloyl-ACP methyl ester carboxylesterase